MEMKNIAANEMRFTSDDISEYDKLKWFQRSHKSATIYERVGRMGGGKDEHS